MALYNMPKMGGLFLCIFFVDKWLVIWYTESDLWITYEEGKVDHELKISNWITRCFQLPYFPSYTLSKWSNKSMQKILAHMWPYNFLHFSQQYTVHIMDRREKIDLDFLMCVYGLCQTNFPPVIYAYIQSRRRCANEQDRRGGSNRQRAYLA